MQFKYCDQELLESEDISEINELNFAYNTDINHCAINNANDDFINNDVNKKNELIQKYLGDISKLPC